jgi:hypothetical protein
MKGVVMPYLPFSDEDGSHPCDYEGCDNIVMYDDEPYCYEHSPDSGSSFIGYSYKASHNL